MRPEAGRGLPPVRASAERGVHGGDEQGRQLRDVVEGVDAEDGFFDGGLAVGRDEAAGQLGVLVAGVGVGQVPVPSPYSVPAAAAAEILPKTTPECHPRDSMSSPPSASPARGPVSYPKMAPSRKRSPETRPTCGAAASIAGRTSQLLCSGASGW